MTKRGSAPARASERDMFFLLPYATERPRRRVPFVTYALFAANCAVYLLYQLPAAMSGPGAGVLPFAFVPARPEAGALLLSMFSHAGIVHLAGNMLYLWLFGSIVEDVLGPLLFLMFYLGGQVGATLLDVAMAQAFAPATLAVPRVGASGAVSAVLGLSAVCFPRVRVRVAYFVMFWLWMWRSGVWRVPAWLFLGFWLMQQVAGGFLSTGLAATTGAAMGGVAYWAHIGGFAAGVIGAYVLALPGRIRRRDLLSGTPQGWDEGYARYADLQNLLRRSPQDPEAWLALAESKEALGLGAEAAEAYARAATLFLQQREPERAARAYLGVLRHDPNFTHAPGAQFDIALGLTRLGEYHEALAALHKLLQVYPGSPEAEPALVRAGDLAERLGDRAAALEYYAELLRRYPYSEWRDYAWHKVQALRG